jgi:TolB-like protein
MSLWSELKQRSVVQVGTAYAIAAWLIVQVAATLLPAFGAPSWVLRVIVLLLGLGFLLALFLAWAYDVTPEGIKRASDTPATEGGRSVTRRRLNYLVIGLLTVAVTMLATSAYVPHRSASGSTGGGRAAATSEQSLAVLPFVNASSDREQEYFADGLSDELMSTLGRIRGLRVTGRTSAFYLKGRNDPPAAIAAALEVDHILSGTVLRSGDQLRIIAALVDAHTGYQLWSKTYEREMDDIFVIQDDIAHSVAWALQIALGVGDLARLPGMTRNVAAYEAFVEATGLYGRYTPDSVRRAIERVERAVALDPSFAYGFFALSDYYGGGAVLVPGQVAEWREKALAAYERGKQLAPDAPYVAFREANLAAAAGNPLALGAFLRDTLPALDAEYGEQNTDGMTGVFLLRMGRNRDAIRHLERLRAADPLSGGVAAWLGEAYMHAGAGPAALAEFDRGVPLGVSVNEIRGASLVTALAMKDRAEIDRRLAAIDDDALGQDVNLRMARFLDNPAEAPAEIRRLAASESPDENPLAYNLLALWAGYYGDPQTALRLTRQIPRDLGANLILLQLWRPVFREMRRLPDFKDFVRELGLVEYWREFGWGDFCRPTGDNDFDCA